MNFDLVFLSYSEPNAENNFNILKSRFPMVKRLHGVKGLARAIKLTAEIVDTEHYWLIDGDNEILPEFNFDVPRNLCNNTHYIWSCKNPINDLSYGYGGVKLLTKTGVRKFSNTEVDVTISGDTKIVFNNTVASITHFNTSAFDAWKAGFREGCMLSSPENTNTKAQIMLNIWKTIGVNKPFGNYAIAGVYEGEKFNLSCLNNKEELLKINDVDWLLNEFNLKRHSYNFYC